jgi:shikimate kinase
MKAPVICFSGRIGSGKTSVSRSVAAQTAAAWTSFGDLIREIAMSQSLDPESREILQMVGERVIRERGVAWLCSEVIRRSGWMRDKVLVIDGVRHVSVFDELVSQLSGHRTYLVYLDLKEACERVNQQLSPQNRQVVESHSTERDVLQALPERADLVVSTVAPLESVVQDVVEFVCSVATPNG